MDWSRSKTIFIIVFLILNAFLYSQYINRYEEGKKIEMPGDKSIEAELSKDNITYKLPSNIESATFISGKVRNFNDLVEMKNPNVFMTVRDQHILVATFREPYRLANIDKGNIEQFLRLNVIDGDSYKLWSIDKENHYALFFQLVNGRVLFYNDKSYIKVYWDEDGNIFTYEQAMVEQLEEYEQKEDIMTPIQVIQILYSRNLLTSNSHVEHMELGYSTLVQLTQRQVFVPTWEIEVKTEAGTLEKYYVNAADGKVIDMNLNKEVVEEQ